MMTRIIAKSLYGLFGAVCVAAGVIVLSIRTGLLPEAANDVIMSNARGDLNTLHVVQEFGSALVFVGLATLWFIPNYERSLPLHAAMTVFLLLFALIHWYDVRGPSPSLAGPLINTIPFALFLAVGALRVWAERPSESK